MTVHFWFSHASASMCLLLKGWGSMGQLCIYRLRSDGVVKSAFVTRCLLRIHLLCEEFRSAGSSTYAAMRLLKSTI